MQPHPKDGLSMGQTYAAILFPTLISRMQYAVRVSLSDCFCPMGQRDRGVENPRLFKDRPTDGKRSGYAAPF